jgi:hypothetical protein
MTRQISQNKLFVNLDVTGMTPGGRGNEPDFPAMRNE